LRKVPEPSGECLIMTNKLWIQVPVFRPL
jgi:hypothetical protein